MHTHDGIVLESLRPGGRWRGSRVYRFVLKIHRFLNHTVYDPWRKFSLAYKTLVTLFSCTISVAFPFDFSAVIFLRAEHYFSYTNRTVCVFNRCRVLDIICIYNWHDSMTNC